MSGPIHTVRRDESFTIAGLPAAEIVTPSGLSIASIIPDSVRETAAEMERVVAETQAGLIVPESKILRPKKTDIPAQRTEQPPTLDQAEAVRFVANPLLYVRNKLLERIEEPSIEQQLLLESIFDDLQITDAYRIRLVQPKITESEYFDKRAGKRITTERTEPSDFEEMAIQILEIMSTVHDVSRMPGMKPILERLTLFSHRALKATTHYTNEYSNELLSLRGGGIFKAGYELLDKSVLNESSRGELYKLLDAFDVSSEYSNSMLEKMDALSDLENPLASRLLINVLRTSGEHGTQFVQEQIRRSRSIKEVYAESSPTERGSLHFMEELCKAAKGVVFDIEAIESLYGKRVGIEVEYRPIRDLAPVPFRMTRTRISVLADPDQYEIRTTKDDIEIGPDYLLRLDNLRRYLNLYALSAQGSSHMHLDQEDFETPQALLGTVTWVENGKSSFKDATWELRYGLPIDLFHENNTRNFINFLLFHTSSMNEISKELDIQIESRSHAHWLALERVPTKVEGLIAKLQAINTDSLSGLIGFLKPMPFFEAWATLPVEDLLGYLIKEEAMHAYRCLGDQPDNVATYIYERRIRQEPPLTPLGMEFLEKQYGKKYIAENFSYLHPRA